MLKIGDNLFYEGKEYVVLWIYANGNCELVEKEIKLSSNRILVHIDKLKKV